MLVVYGEWPPKSENFENHGSQGTFLRRLSYCVRLRMKENKNKLQVTFICDHILMIGPETNVAELANLETSNL